MNEDGTPGPSPLDDSLYKLPGDEAAEEASRAMRAQGFDLSQPPEGSSDLTVMKVAVNQFQFPIDSTIGSVNWRLATDSAHQQIYIKGDPAPSAAQVDRACTAMTVTDLWFDTTSDSTPGSVECRVWM